MQTDTEKKIYQENAVAKYKATILKNMDEKEIQFEVGYCYKNFNHDVIFGGTYWTDCYCFLKGLAHYHGIEVMA